MLARPSAGRQRKTSKDTRRATYRQCKEAPGGPAEARRKLLRPRNQHVPLRTPNMTVEDDVFISSHLA